MNTEKTIVKKTVATKVVNETETDKSIGAIWKRTSKEGTEYLYCKLELEGKEIEMVAFLNKFAGGNRPTYRLFARN
jgi:uncharacterized protein (DUF736 family)